MTPTERRRVEARPEEVSCDSSQADMLRELIDQARSHRVDVKRARAVLYELLPRASHDACELIAELGELEAPGWLDLDRPRRRAIVERHKAAKAHGDIPLALACELVLGCGEPDSVESTIVLALIYHCMEVSP